MCKVGHPSCCPGLSVAKSTRSPRSLILAAAWAANPGPRNRKPAGSGGGGESNPLTEVLGHNGFEARDLPFQARPLTCTNRPPTCETVGWKTAAACPRRSVVDRDCPSLSPREVHATNPAVEHKAARARGISLGAGRASIIRSRSQRVPKILAVHGFGGRATGTMLTPRAGKYPRATGQPKPGQTPTGFRLVRVSEWAADQPGVIAAFHLDTDRFDSDDVLGGTGGHRRYGPAGVVDDE